MRRRDFLATSAAASCLAAASGRLAAAQGPDTGGRMLYELRRYQLKDEEKLKGFDQFMSEAAIPAAGRVGDGPIGVFYAEKPAEGQVAYVLIPFPSLESYFRSVGRLAADAGFMEKSRAFFSQPPSDPAYTRIESSLLLAFEGMPKVEVPAQAKVGKPRIFELRIYESHNEMSAAKKVEMFNRGEIDIFRKTGLTPVFFGQTLFGARMPNLTYMLVFDDMEQREASWKTFIADPDWQKLRAIPEYADRLIVSRITNLFLKPAPYSQI